MSIFDSADLCRQKGWGPGTRLVGDEGHGSTVIEITAVGERWLLAKVISHNGEARHGAERLCDLGYREWQEVTA